MAAIQAVREQQPDQYLKVVASLVPKDINVTVDPFEDMSDEKLKASILMLREALREQGFDLDQDAQDDPTRP